MIDKVVRMRGKGGKFGIDHSEILNFEFEFTNKDRSDYMNRLSYWNQPQLLQSNLLHDFTNEK